jgi:hypothetical protein
MPKPTMHSELLAYRFRLKAAAAAVFAVPRAATARLNDGIQISCRTDRNGIDATDTHSRSLPLLCRRRAHSRNCLGLTETGLVCVCVCVCRGMCLPRRALRVHSPKNASDMRAIWRRSPSQPDSMMHPRPTSLNPPMRISYILNIIFCRPMR